MGDEILCMKTNVGDVMIKINVIYNNCWPSDVYKTHIHNMMILNDPVAYIKKITDQTKTIETIDPYFNFDPEDDVDIQSCQIKSNSDDFVSITPSYYTRELAKQVPYFLTIDEHNLDNLPMYNHPIIKICCNDQSWKEKVDYLK